MVQLLSKQAMTNCKIIPRWPRTFVTSRNLFICISLSMRGVDKIHKPRTWSYSKHEYLIVGRGGVKLEFVRNSFDSIRKSAIRLIRKGKKYSKNSMKFNLKFVRFDLTPTIGWSQIFQMLDSFEIRLIQFQHLCFER